MSDYTPAVSVFVFLILIISSICLVNYLNSPKKPNVESMKQLYELDDIIKQVNNIDIDSYYKKRITETIDSQRNMLKSDMIKELSTIEFNKLKKGEK